jgi:hypothetical protein
MQAAKSHANSPLARAQASFPGLILTEAGHPCCFRSLSWRPPEAAVTQISRSSLCHELGTLGDNAPDGQECLHLALRHYGLHICLSLIQSLSMCSWTRPE